MKIQSWAKDMEFQCCPEPYSTVTYEFQMNRLSLYYFLYVILPLIAQVFLFLMVFHIPYETGERMGFGVTILLSITVYLLVISEKLPEKSDNIPMLGVCFIAEFYLLCAALIMAGINIMLSRKTNKPPLLLLNLTKAYSKPWLRKQQEEVPEIISLCEHDGYLQCESANQDVETTCNGTSPHLIEDKRFEQRKPYYNTNNREWRKICRSLDKIYFNVFMFFTIFVPIIISCSLNHDHLGL